MTEPRRSPDDDPARDDGQEASQMALRFERVIM
jgi:hypothetical protein